MQPVSAYSERAPDLQPKRQRPQTSVARERLPRRGHAPAVAWLPWALRAAMVAGLAGCGAFALRYGVHPAEIIAASDLALARAGLDINQVAVVGYRNALSEDIFAALRLEQAGSILSYDTAAARQRLESLAWVASAQVSRVLPDGLSVTIRERQPFAVWQHRQLMFLIDADGRTLEPASRSDHPDLPLVVGEGADESTAELLDLVKQFPAIQARMTAAVRVAGRRWDLELRDAPRLLLPEEAPGTALAWVDKMQREERLFDRRLTEIDLRVANRLVFHLAPEAAARAPARSGGHAAVQHGGGV